MAQVEFDVVANDKATSAINSIAVAAGNILADLASQATAAIVDFTKESISAASNLNETLNKTNVIFGETSQSIVDWSKTAAESVGLSAQEALDAAAMMATFGSAAGLAGQDLNNFATDNVKLAADMASFFNTSVQDASIAIQSAFRGETEPIRRYGVMLDDASMRIQALKMGLIETTKQALTPQQKVLAAQALIMAQTTAAADDFAETSDGLANSQRILDAQVKDLQAQFGQFLLPVVQELTSFASSNLIPIFEKVFKIFDDGVVTVGEIKRQLFLLGVPASALDYVFGELLPGIVAVSTELWSKFAPVLQNIASQVMPFLNEQIEKFSAWFVENSPLIAETATTIGTALAAAFAFFADNILPFLLTGLGGLIDLILGLATAMMEFINGDWQSGLAALAEIPFVAVWIKNFQQLITMMKLLGTKVGEFISKFIDFGKNIVLGILQGIQDSWDMVVTWLSDALTELVNSTLALLGIQSPSKVFANIGRNMSLGLAQGISEGMGAAQGAMISGVAGVTSGAIGASSYALSNYGSINVQLTGEQATARSFLEDLGVMMGA